MNAAENVFHLLLLLKRESWRMKWYTRYLHGGLASRPFLLLLSSADLRVFHWLLTPILAYSRGPSVSFRAYSRASPINKRIWTSHSISTAKNYPILLQLI
jgi:hypothetical protein